MDIDFLLMPQSLDGGNDADVIASTQFRWRLNEIGRKVKDETKREQNWNLALKSIC